MAKAIAQFTIYDLSDITVNNVAPTNPVKDQLWLDTSITPNRLKKWTGSSWTLTGASSLAELDSNASAKLTGIEKTVSNHTVTLEAHAKDIALKVASQTYTEKMASVDGSLKTLGENLTTASGDIKVLQDNIKLKVEQTDIDRSIGDVQIGGRNLVLNSKEAVTNGLYLIKTYTMSENWIPGETYTLTLKGNTGSTSKKFGMWQNGGSIHRGYFSSTNGTSSITFTAASPIAGWENKFDICNYPSSVSATGTIEWVVLERGNKGSVDWIPAPEDTDASITKVDNKVADLTLTVNGISQKVTSVEVATGNAQTTADSKSKTFTSQPAPPYRIGDIWLSTSASGVAKVCTVTRLTGSYVATDWVEDSSSQRIKTAEQKLTPDSIVNTVRSSTQYKSDLDGKTGTNDVKSIIEQNPTSVKTGFNGINDIVEITEYGTIFKHPTIGTKTKIDSKGFGIYEINDKDFENPLGSFWGSGNAGFENVISTEVKANKVYAENIESIQEESVTYYVRPGFGDNTFEGTMFDAPFDSVNYALSKINKIIPRGISVTIMVYGDIYESIVVEGFRGGGTLTINFDATSKVYSQIVAANVDLPYFYINGGRTTYNVNNGCMIETTDEHGFEFLKVANYEIKGFRGNCIISAGADKYKYMLHAVASRGSVRWLDSYGYYGQIYSEQCSITRVHDNRGRGSRGYLAYYGSIILGGHDGAGTCMPIGTNTIYEGGIIDIKGKTEAADCLWNPTNTPSPTPTKKVYTKSWSATSTQSWRDSYGWRSDNRYIYQGDYGYGNHRGFICFNDGDIRTQLSGATIKSARLYLKRRSAGGSSASQRATMYLHGYSSTGGGYSLGTLIGSTVGYAWGTGAWSSIPVNAIKSLQNGTARGIALYASGGSPYIIFEATATLEITYEK